MENESHGLLSVAGVKSGTSLKSRMSRGNFLMFGMLLLAFCVFTNRAMGQNVTVNVTTSGTLRSLIGSQKNSITGLKVTGNLNGDDMLCIREMAGRDIDGNSTSGELTTLDLAGANIVSGGGYYYLNNSTSNNTIGYNMFCNCNKLTNITLPGSVTLIGFSAFQYTGLTGISIPNTVTSIEESAFSGCSNLKTVTIEDGTVELTFIPYTVNSYSYFYNDPVETLYLGRNISIQNPHGINPFGENMTLKSVTIGNNVTTINDYSFQNCTGLQSLFLGNGLITIGVSAFSGCSNLNNVAIPSKVKIVRNSTFQGCRTLSSIIIPNTVTSIEESAFSGCSNLKTVTIEDGTIELTFIPYTVNSYSYFYNDPVETLYLGRNISIQNPHGINPFGENTTLKSVTIGNNVTAINNNSFQNCTGLTNITIPSSITSIGSSAFSGCILINIHSQRSTPPSAADGCFYNVYANCKLYVPTGSTNAYKAATEWKKFFTFIEEVITGINAVPANPLKIFPNPVKDELTIERDHLNKENETVQIIDYSGRIVINSQFLPSGSQLKINVSHLQSGVYVVRTGNYRSKFIKE